MQISSALLWVSLKYLLRSLGELYRFHWRFYPDEWGDSHCSLSRDKSLKSPHYTAILCKVFTTVVKWGWVGMCESGGSFPHLESLSIHPGCWAFKYLSLFLWEEVFTSQFLLLIWKTKCITIVGKQGWTHRAESTLHSKHISVLRVAFGISESRPYLLTVSVITFSLQTSSVLFLWRVQAMVVWQMAVFHLSLRPSNIPYMNVFKKLHGS